MQSTSSPERLRFALVATMILLAGFALRLALYDYHGLEGDDGFSLALSRYPLGTLIPGLLRLELDVHPPLHFVALKGWTALAGDSLLALRGMNILADTLVGALLVRLAGRSFAARIGLAAGVLWVVAPLLIYAGWLARMYALLALFVTAGAVCVVEITRAPRVRWYAGLGLCALAALYTHVTGVIAVLTFALALAVDAILRRDARRLVTGLLPLLAAGLLYLPFALPVLDVYRSGRTLGAEINTSRFASPYDVPGTVLNTMLLHRLTVQPMAIAVALAVSSAGLWRQYRRRAAPLLVLAWGGFAGMTALAWLADLYKPRYLAPFVPFALALVAGLLALIPRRAVHAGTLVVLVGVSALGIRADLDRATRDDWTAAAQFVAAHERPGDAVIVIPDWGQEAFRYHYGGAAPVTGVFPRLSTDVDYAPVLQSLTAGRDGVWLVRYQPEVSDADNLATAWFRERAATVTEVFPAGMQVWYYDFAPRKTALPPDARPLDARFGGAAALRGVYLPVNHGSARDARLHPPSNWIQVILYWEILTAGADFIPRVRLTDAFGQVYGAALEREHGVLQRSPVNSWMPGDIWQVGYDLNVNPETPPGAYHLEVMALDPATGEPLPAAGADAGANWAIVGGFVIE